MDERSGAWQTTCIVLLVVSLASMVGGIFLGVPAFISAMLGASYPGNGGPPVNPAFRAMLVPAVICIVGPVAFGATLMWAALKMKRGSIEAARAAAWILITPVVLAAVAICVAFIVLPERDAMMVQVCAAALALCAVFAWGICVHLRRLLRERHDVEA